MGHAFTIMSCSSIYLPVHPTVSVEARKSYYAKISTMQNDDLPYILTPEFVNFNEHLVKSYVGLGTQFLLKSRKLVI